MTQESKPGTPSLPVRLAAGFVTLLIGLGIGALLLEAATRLLVDDGMDFDLEMWKYARDLKQQSQNLAIGHEHVPSSSGTYMGVPVSTNSAGMRDREFALAKTPGVTRVLMLGDSVTFGWGVAAEDTPSKLLEARLNDNPEGRTFEVINTGVGNYNSSMEVASFLTKWKDYAPDVVILNYFINDAEPTPRRRDSTLLERSAAAVYIFAAIDKLKRQYFGKSDWKQYYAGLYEGEPEAWKANKEAIEELIAYCKANGVRLMLVNYPELHELDPYPFEQVTAAIGAIAEQGGVPFVDLLPSVKTLDPESLWVSPTDAHPNKIANEAFAGSMADAMKAKFPDLFR